MRTRHSMRVALGLLLTLAVGTTACNDKKERGGSQAPTLAVTPAQLVLGADSGTAGTFTLTTSAAWNAAISGAGFTLDRNEGMGDATLTVTATAANSDPEQTELGSVTISATGVSGAQSVAIFQRGGAVKPQPDNVTITLDFSQGVSIATPALPASSADALSARKTYTMGGYDFALFADAAQNGKYYWLDNSQYNPGLPEPTKGLYFSKLGAYIEFPAIAGLTLAKVTYTPTSSQSSDVQLELTKADGTDAQYSQTFDEDGASIYEPIAAEEGAAYRLAVLKSNAQMAGLVLEYTHETE